MSSQPIRLAGLAGAATCALFLASCDPAGRDWALARDAGTVDAMEEFLAEHSESIYADSARITVAELDSVSWGEATRANTARAYEEYLARFPDGRMAGLAVPALERQRVIRQIVPEVLRRPAYAALPTGISALSELSDTTSPNSVFKQSGQALEDMAILDVERSGTHNRFVIGDVVVHGDAEPHRFSMKVVPPGSRMELAVRPSTRGAWSLGAATFRAGVSDATLVMFTDYPDDEVAIFDSSGALSVGVGSWPFSSFGISYFRTAIHYSAGTVWRFYGKISLPDGYTFEATTVNPFVFYLGEGVGAVHLCGEGIVAADGEQVFETTMGYTDCGLSSM